MIGAIWNGISGINAFDRAISAESNNNTNTSTVGYKSSEVRFEDMMYQNGLGTGTQIESINKRFTQGDIINTGHTFDVGIEGKGYFIVNEPSSSETFYTRAGNFQMGPNGLLQTPDGLKVQGITPQTAPTVITTNPAFTKLSNVHTRFVASETIQNENFIQTINSRVSDYTKTAVDSGTSGDGFKTASTKIQDVEALMADYNDKLSLYRSVSTQPATASVNQITSLDFSSYVSELSGPNDFIKITINDAEIKQQFDTDLDTTMRLFADKISKVQGLVGTVDTTVGKVTVESLIPGKEVRIYDAAVNDKAASINQVQDQKLGTGYGLVTSSRDALQKAIVAAGAEFIDITSNINLTNQNALNVNNINMKLADQNLSEFAFGKVDIVEGVIYLSDGDNKFVVGKVQTAFFRNDQGLDAQGNNLYKSTAEAGVAQYAGNLNTLHTNSLEVSNTTFTDSMSNLLVYQKSFEANSKSITTSDELLKIAINLRK